MFLLSEDISESEILTENIKEDVKSLQKSLSNIFLTAST